MSKRVALASLLLLVSLRASAQSYPGGEIFGGFSYSNVAIGPRDNSLGWQMSFSVNPHRRVRLVGDFGGQYRRANVTFLGQRATLRNYQFLWGPQFTQRRGRATLFAHTLFGVAASHLTTPSGDPAHPQNVIAIDYGFAMGFGGGVDVNAGDRFAIRIFQADYIPTRLRPEPLLAQQLPRAGNWQQNFRLGFGLVVKVGKRL